MRILLVGSGGREHALCRAIAASPMTDALFVAPGNAGIAEEAEVVAIGTEDLDGLVDFAKIRAIDLVVVGPEAPLVAGLVDRLEAVGISAFGPSRAAAILEASKNFTKEFCTRHAIPTAAYGSFSEIGPARDFIRARGAPIVVKVDGLAAGKGVTVAASVAEATAAAEAALAGHFGGAGARIIVEECLTGEEISFHALVDGKTALPLASAQDHKRVGDGDTGPNTGGMGAYSPASVMTPALEAEVMEKIIRPTVAGMAAEGRPFKGVLFAGLMITQEGPKLLEYNVRFGDPECQVLMSRLMSDLVTALIATREGQLAHMGLRWYDDPAICVVMAARGYPGPPVAGTEIRGLGAAAEAAPDVTVYHAGTARNGSGRLIATGGRVLGVTATGSTLVEARRRAYAAIERIDWPEGFCRRDIGARAARQPA